MPHRIESTVRHRWLEEIEGSSAVLLVAPHGGKADSARRGPVNPKINDLHTADITRELAARVGAAALINTALDRNSIDLNRMSQLLARAPWFIELVAERVGRIVERHGHAVVLLIHGWNVIQPRVDVGIGLKRHGDELRPPGSARVSASDEFINGALGRLSDRLGTDGILTTFGLRYPAGGAQNLLQAFTDRHAESATAALRALSAMASRGEIDAAQLELSVALRMPGRHRERCVEVMAEVFGRAPVAGADIAGPGLRIIRAPTPRSAHPATPRTGASATAGRVGLECFDPHSRVGAMASFDLGPGGVGARIMILLPDGRVALFTTEGRTRLEGARASVGPLVLEARGERLGLRFRGPVMMVPDATSYLRLERAIASGWLDESAQVELEMEPYGAAVDPRAMFSGAECDSGAQASFGALAGELRVDGIACEFRGFGRAGSSFTALGPNRFASRRMIWACFNRDAAPLAVEIRSHAGDGEPERSSGRILNAGAWSTCGIARVELETGSVSERPVRLGASFAESASRERALVGEVESFVPLSRPGPAGTRIFTSLGFARFSVGSHQGGGLFEYSHRAERGPEGEADTGEASEDD